MLLSKLFDHQINHLEETKSKTSTIQPLHQLKVDVIIKSFHISTKEIILSKREIDDGNVMENSFTFGSSIINIYVHISSTSCYLASHHPFVNNWHVHFVCIFLLLVIGKFNKDERARNKPSNDLHTVS